MSLNTWLANWEAYTGGCSSSATVITSATPASGTVGSFFTTTSTSGDALPSSSDESSKLIGFCAVPKICFSADSKVSNGASTMFVICPRSLSCIAGSFVTWCVCVCVCVCVEWVCSEYYLKQLQQLLEAVVFRFGLYLQLVLDCLCPT